MIELGLTKAEAAAYERALRSDHRVRLEVEILDSNERRVTNLSFPENRVLGGQVDVDVDSEVTRQLSLEILDPERRLPFVPKNAAQGGVFAENMLAVKYCVEVLETDMWVEVPVFRGPISLYNHGGNVVLLEGLGKETLGLHPHVLNQGFTLRKGLPIDDAIKRVMWKVGERRFDIPPLAGMRLPRDYVAMPGQEPWRLVVGGEDEVTEGGSGKLDPLITLTKEDHYAFYNGRGKLVVRRRRRPAVFRYDDYLTQEPSLSYDVLEFRNHVRVNGAPAKGKQKAVVGEASLPAAHPLSPESLKRNGEKRYMTVTVNAPNLKTERDCKDKAADVLETVSKAGLEVSFESLVVPHLEEWDQLRVATEHGDVDFPLRQFTIPLTATETMSVGFNKRVRQYAKGSGKKREARERRRRRRRRNRKRRNKDKKKKG